MNTSLNFSNGVISGEGRDEIGLFTWSGIMYTVVKMTKTYVGKCSVDYEGRILNGAITGTFVAGSETGDFELRRNNSIEASGIIMTEQMLNGSSWSGYEIKRERRSEYSSSSVKEVGIRNEGCQKAEQEQENLNVSSVIQERRKRPTIPSRFTYGEESRQVREELNYNESEQRKDSYSNQATSQSTFEQKSELCSGPSNNQMVEVVLGDARWKGFYEQFGKRFPMEFSLNINKDGSVIGNGIDGIGKFTWSGLIGKDGASTLTKQYLGAHSVKYVGQLKGKILAGTYYLGNDSGPFELTRE